jgi:glycerol-3-phosphate dehydrogenase (NAD(P)+)
VNIGILGAGSWGIALSVLLQRRGHSVRMWEFSAADAQMLFTKREHPKKLPGIIIPPEVMITSNVGDVIATSEFIVCVVPTQTTRQTMKTIAASVNASAIDAIQGWVIASKGIECETLCLITDILMQELPGMKSDRLVVLSGPSHAEEVSRDIPTTVVAASENFNLATRVQNEFSTESFRIYTNSDIRGVQLSGGVKNVIAIAAGICDGLGFGDNTKGAILTRGMVEMVRLGRRMGAQEQTFSGLAGIGDLITTCMSRHSRNRKVGEMIGKGMNLSEALGQMVMVAEGVETTKSVYKLAEKNSIEMPITDEVYKTLFEGKNTKLAARDLMTRQSKPERW